MCERTLYLYTRTVDENPPAWKIFRLNRIRVIEATGTTFMPNPTENDGFFERQKNAFLTFIRENPRKITIKFSGDIIPYITEREWHHSQEIKN